MTQLHKSIGPHTLPQRPRPEAARTRTERSHGVLAALKGASALGVGEEGKARKGWVSAEKGCARPLAMAPGRHGRAGSADADHKYRAQGSPSSPSGNAAQPSLGRSAEGLRREALGNLAWSGVTDRDGVRRGSAARCSSDTARFRADMPDETRASAPPSLGRFDCSSLSMPRISACTMGYRSTSADDGRFLSSRCSRSPQSRWSSGE